MSNVRVMIVEDQPSYQELVQVVLSLDPQFEVVAIASDGNEALDGFVSVARPRPPSTSVHPSSLTE